MCWGEEVAIEPPPPHIQKKIKIIMKKYIRPKTTCVVIQPRELMAQSFGVDPDTKTDNPLAGEDFGWDDTGWGDSGWGDSGWGKK